MIRTLIIAVLLTGAAVQALGAPPDAALGYSLLLCFTVWLTWPPARWALRQMRRGRGRRHPALRPPAATPHLTQINHHHYYYGAPPAAPRPRVDHALLALPRQSHQQRAHDAIYNTIDLDDTP